MSRCAMLSILLCAGLLLFSAQARADDCRATFENEYLGEINNGLPSNMERAQISGCEIYRTTGGGVFLSVSGSVLVRLNGGFLGKYIRRRLSGRIDVMLNGSCTAARVSYYSLAFLDFLPSGWVSSVGEKVPRYRGRPPLVSYCS